MLMLTCATDSLSTLPGHHQEPVLEGPSDLQDAPPAAMQDVEMAISVEDREYLPSTVSTFLSHAETQQSLIPS
jgi:hypothetical protein